MTEFSLVSPDWLASGGRSFNHIYQIELVKVHLKRNCLFYFLNCKVLFTSPSSHAIILAICHWLNLDRASKKHFKSNEIIPISYISHIKLKHLLNRFIVCVTKWTKRLSKVSGSNLGEIFKIILIHITSSVL